MTARANGLADLKRVFRVNQQNPSIRNLSDNSFLAIFETLFEIALSEKSAWLGATKPTLRSAADTRLSNVASAIRVVVECGSRTFRLKAARTLLEHVIETLPISGGGLCSPLALDYARCLRALLSFQPHVEHLPRDVWERTASFCIQIIKGANGHSQGDSSVSAAEAQFITGTSSGVSYRSSHSYLRESAQSQGDKLLLKQVADEMVTSLSFLTAAPNAPISGDANASVMLHALIDFLRVGDRSYQEAFAAINNLLSRTRIEHINLTEKVTNQLVRLIRHLWAQQKEKTRDEMLITLLYLRPYIARLMGKSETLTLRADLTSLQDAMRGECNRRPEENLLRLTDLQFVYDQEIDLDQSSVRTSIFALRCVSGRAESSSQARIERGWALITMLATFCGLTMSVNHKLAASNEDGEVDDSTFGRSKKRQKITTELDDILNLTSSGTVSERLCALQTLTFLAQDVMLSSKQLSLVLERLSICCSEDNSSVASWALLALSSCASQQSASEASILGLWGPVWQAANRATTNVSTCRGACHLLTVLIELQLVPQANVSDLFQTVLRRMDLTGPAILADSVLHLLSLALKRTQQSSPQANSSAAESILGWLFRFFTPSAFEDKAYAATHHLYSTKDIITLVNVCANYDQCPNAKRPYPQWGAVAQAWIACSEQQDLVSYLLLLQKQPAFTNPRLLKATKNRTAVTCAPRLSCEMLILTYLDYELQKLQETWECCRREHPEAITMDMFGSLCDACSIIACLAHCRTFRDVRRGAHIRKQLGDLLSTLRNFLASPECGQDKVDIMLLSWSQMLSGLHESRRGSSYAATECEKILCSHISKILIARKRAANQSQVDLDDDLMEMSEDYSQDSRRGKVRSSGDADELQSDYQVTFSPLALRSTIDVYATIIHHLDINKNIEGDLVNSHSIRMVDYIVGLPEANIIAARKVISALPSLGVTLEPEDIERLLDHCTKNMLSNYSTSRSEVTHLAISDVMASFIRIWTDPTKKSLYNLGIDTYEFIMQLLERGMLSPTVQRRIASLLLQICHVNMDYGVEYELKSVRTSLFKLLRSKSVSVQYYLANQISVIFGLFVLSAHDAMFDDLNKTLPTESDWKEGMAMRLLLLSKLASAWHSLRRQCVYYIFEAAGLLQDCAQYAAHCIAMLAQSLKFDTAQKLFRLFAPQLLHTWLEHYTLHCLPYAAFQYSSLNELLDQNQVEIVAQLMMRGKEDGLQVLCAELKMSKEDLAKHAFAKSLAYTIGWDIVASSGEGTEAHSEARLRGYIGGKEELKRLAHNHFPTVMGQFYLSAQQVDVQDNWIEKRSSYTNAAKSLSEMKRYSHSERSLPKAQQPSFRITYLPDQTERLCRRTGLDPVRPFNSSSFALAARILLDSIDDALGPLHTCLILRKLRILICMAGDVVFHGFVLEMLVHAIRPFLSDSECADDALGILQYLLQHSRTYLGNKGHAFANGIVCLMILQMSEYTAARQESTTQESQHRITVHKMGLFRTWLVQYLQKCIGKHSNAHVRLFQALSTIQLPGNAHKDSPESHLLLLLLEERSTSHVQLLDSHCDEALRLLTKKFEGPATLSDDCLGQDDMSIKYADSLWRSMKQIDMNDTFKTWGAGVIGRAFAATGKRPRIIHPQSDVQPEIGSRERSESSITQVLIDLMLSRSGMVAGLAEWTMRSIVSAFAEAGDAEEAMRFQQMLPDNIVPAIAEGAYGYRPPSVNEFAAKSLTRQQLHNALEVSRSTTDGEWAMNVAISFCLWASNVSILSALPNLLRTVPGLAEKLLPWITHIILLEEVDKDPVVYPELSASLAAHFALRDEALHSRQRFLISILLYLRSQTHPEEKNKADRLSHWLKIDPLEAADAAARCGMPTSALMLAESINPTTLHDRRATGRVSLSQMAPVKVSNELLLQIFKQIEEPDSYYGVQQPASLDAVLERLDYEGSGFKSLMFRSAQLDNAMRSAHLPLLSDSTGLMRSLSILNLNSLEYALLSGPMANSSNTTGEMLDVARKLQQWDTLTSDAAVGGSATSFHAFQELSRTTELSHMVDSLRAFLLEHVKSDKRENSSGLPSIGWCNTLAVLTEFSEILDCQGDISLESRWATMQSRMQWMNSARFEDAQTILSARSTLFSVLAANTSLIRGMHVGTNTLKLMEARSLIDIARAARDQSVLQEALSAATQLTSLASESKKTGLRISAGAALETATVLWESGEATTSVKMLQDITMVEDCDTQDIVVGPSGLLAQLAHQLAEARLSTPDEILETCLKPAIKKLNGRNQGQEAGRVFHEFAAFCDQQLQNPGNMEDFNRIAKLRQKRLDELEELDALAQNSKKTTAERNDAKRAASKAKQWFIIDDGEYQRLKESRDSFAVQSLQNYLLALSASEEHDIDVLRLFAMWLENADSPVATATVSKHLDSVPSWKFAVLINQLMSRLEDTKSTFQASLKALVQRICGDHPYHSLHQLFASTRRPAPGSDEMAMSRYRAAASIRTTLQSTTRSGELVKDWFQANNAYITFAHGQIEKGRDSIAVKDFLPANSMVSNLKRLRVPPATVDVPLQPDKNYSEVPLVKEFDRSFSVMGGISAPKCITVLGTDGKKYKQLFKGGNDDLRQDAIMEQVFEEVSKILRKHKATRQRGLRVRTYKVIPLATKSGIIEFVPNSIPIGEFLRPAHVRYYPKSYKYHAAISKIREVEKQSLEVRVAEYRKIADQTPPVMRHFFFERFDDPDEWFEKRTAYTRTTASVSILGHVLGLGDRHCHNILLDEKSGEAIHIDLGVAFEAGRVLPIPETVPFRLTRDIVDGMGVTKTEGVFRRCCEFTLDALRDDKDSIMTLLNVLRYDPLYNWTLSPLRAKRIQDAQETGRNVANGEDQAGSKRSQQEAGEAERALSIVEKKLSKTLSTAATVSELIQQATDEKNLATLFAGWSAWQ